MYNETFLEKIVSQFRNKINQIALYRLTQNDSFNPETALFEMKSYGYNDISEYARSKFI